MGNLVLSGATSGATTLQPTDATTQTITFPSGNGTVITTGSSGQAIPTAALPAGSVLQVVTTTTTSSISGTLGGSNNPAYNSGYSYCTMSFTPVSATSKLLIISSPLQISEYTNDNNTFWLAAFYDTTRICCTAGTAEYNNFANNRNAGYYGLNFSIASWGTTTKTVDFRVGSDAAGTGMAVNFNYLNNMNQSAMQVGFTIMEIAA